LALRYYFDFVCPHSYILGFEVKRAEDDGLAEIEWLPFELRPAPKELPEPRGTYIRDHWRDHVYELATTHEVETHVLRYQPRSTLALPLHSFAEEEGQGRAYRDAAHRAFFIEGLNLADEGGVTRGGPGGGPGGRRGHSGGLGSREDLGPTSDA
jgi:predicted DsbA family dithiol-disulfide isomerase